MFIVLVLATASADSTAAAVDSETITLNSGALQTFEILPVSSRLTEPSAREQLASLLEMLHEQVR